MPLVCHRGKGGQSVHSALELHECRFGLCRRTALHYALEWGHTETAMALVKAGADVHCKSNVGYGSRASSLCGCVADSAGADGPVHSALELPEWLCLAVQEDGAALGVGERQPGDGDGAGEGGRRCARQKQRRVRLSGFMFVRSVCSQCGGGRSVHSALELTQWLL